MPIYEYKCSGCLKVFEKVIFNNKQKKILCPYCNSDNIEKIFSTFSLSGSGKSTTLSCGTCAPNPLKCRTCR